MMMTARVSRTWSSIRCSMTGIFLSSSGAKTESCSHLLNRDQSAIAAPESNQAQVEAEVKG